MLGLGSRTRSLTQGSYGNASSGGRMRSEPPGSLIRHNALIGLHQHPIAHLAPAPAPAFNFGPADAPHVALAPAPALAAPGKYYARRGCEAVKAEYEDAMLA